MNQLKLTAITFVVVICNICPSMGQCSINDSEFKSIVFNHSETIKDKIKEYYHDLSFCAQEKYSYEELKQILTPYFYNNNIWVFNDIREFLFPENKINVVESNQYEKGISHYFIELEKSYQKKEWDFDVNASEIIIDNKYIYCFEKLIVCVKAEVKIRTSNNKEYLIDFYITNKGTKEDPNYSICAILKYKVLLERAGISKGIIGENPNATISLNEPSISFNKVKLQGTLIDFNNPPLSIKLKANASSYDIPVNARIIDSSLSLKPYSFYSIQAENFNSNKISFSTKGSKTQFITSLIGSVVCIGLGSYASVASNNNYNKYQSAQTPADAEQFRNQTKSWDTVRNVSFGVSVVPLYFLITSFCKKDPIQELFK